MTDSNIPVRGGSSPEEVAFHLLLRIMEAEGRPLTANSAGSKLTRNVILDAYSDCLEAVRGKRPRKGGLAPRG
jgi:hypothetical protein